MHHRLNIVAHVSNNMLPKMVSYLIAHVVKTGKNKNVFRTATYSFVQRQSAAAGVVGDRDGFFF